MEAQLYMSENDIHFIMLALIKVKLKNALNLKS